MMVDYSNRGTIAVVMALVFLSLFVGLLWLVPRVSRIFGLQGLGAPARPVRIRSGLGSRLVGAVFLTAGCGFVAWTWHDSHSSQRAASRLDPIVPLRAEPAPWHERLSSTRAAAPVPASGPTSLTSGMRPVAVPRLLEPQLVLPVTAQPPAPVASTPKEPETITSRAPEALAALAAAAPSAAGPRGLTRRWGLLSQYDPTAAAPSDATRIHRAAAKSRRFQEQD